MSHPIRAAVPAVLFAVAASAHAGAFDASPAHATPYTDPLVPSVETQPGLVMPADEPAMQNVPPQFRDIDPAADMEVASPAPPARTGADGKPAGIGSVPEPDVYVLLCVGLALLGARAANDTLRRKKNPARIVRTGLLR